MTFRSLSCLFLGLAVASPVAARDRAVTSETLKPCPAKGPGFVRVEGTETCIRLGGRVVGGLDARIDRRGASAGPVHEGRIAIDARTDSDLGPVRTYMRVGSGRR